VFNFIIEISSCQLKKLMCEKVKYVCFCYARMEFFSYLICLYIRSCGDTPLAQKHDTFNVFFKEGFTIKKAVMSFTDINENCEM